MSYRFGVPWEQIKWLNLHYSMNYSFKFKNTQTTKTNAVRCLSKSILVVQPDSSMRLISVFFFLNSVHYFDGGGWMVVVFLKKNAALQSIWYAWVSPELISAVETQVMVKTWLTHTWDEDTRGIHTNMMFLRQGRWITVFRHVTGEFSETKSSSYLICFPKSSKTPSRV